MAKINRITKQTDNRFVNLYHIEGANKNGRKTNYFLASRAGKVEDLKCNTHKNGADGVVIYALMKGEEERVVLIRQYRYAFGGYVYEFPAGLVEEGEEFHAAAVREMHEETGLTLTPLPAPKEYEKPGFTTVGMSDEACATVFGYVTGEISRQYMEENEEIEVVLADRAEVRRILREEQCAIMCSYHLMHFLSDADPFAFLRGGTSSCDPSDVADTTMWL